jgi:folate-binding protein YgfZ
MPTPLQALQQASGARSNPDGLLLTYGDVQREYRAGREGAALFDTTARGRLRVSGADRAEFLHRLLANRVRGLEPGQGNHTLLLNSKGKVLFGFDLVVGADWIDLCTEPGQGPALQKALDMYLFADKVKLEDHSGAAAPLALVGPKAAALIAALAGPLLPAERWSTEFLWQGQPVRLERGVHAGSPAWFLDAGPAGAAPLFGALRDAGATPAGRVAEDFLRVEAGQAAFGADVDDNIYPQEARLERSFALDKGCYIGQEVVAKIDTYGGLNKRLCLLSIDHDDPLPRGVKLIGEDPERGGERELGILTSWAYSFVLDRGLALGYVKRRHQAQGRRFQLRGPADQPLPGSATLVPMPVRPDGLPVSGEFE